MIRLYSDLLHLFCNFFTKRRRTRLDRTPRLIFVFVIVETGNRGDLHDRIRLAVDHAYRIFLSADVLLHDQLILVGKAVSDCLFKFLFCIYNVNAHAGTAARRLYHARKSCAKLLCALRRVRFFNDHTCRSRHAVFAEHLLRDGLIHRKRASEIAASGIGDAKQVKRRLDPSVLAARSVQRQKYHIRRPAHIEHVRAKKSPLLPLYLPD